MSQQKILIIISIITGPPKIILKIRIRKGNPLINTIGSQEKSMVNLNYEAYY